MNEAADPGALPTREEEEADDSALREARQDAREARQETRNLEKQLRAARAKIAQIEHLEKSVGEARRSEAKAVDELHRIRIASEAAVADAERDKLAAEAALRHSKDESLAHATTQQVREAQVRAAKAEDLATRSKSDAAKAIRDQQDLIARLKDAERENQQVKERLKLLKERSSSVGLEEANRRGGGEAGERHQLAPELVVVAASSKEDDRRRLEEAVQDARIADDGRRLAERRFAEVKRQLGVEEARYGRACAERDAALGQVAALHVRTARLRDELQAGKAETTEAVAEAGRARAQVATRVDSSKLKNAEERAEAAKRQVVALDRALDASLARLAASCAARDSDVAELQKRLRAANEA
ncbi:MAG: hypothetical protein AAF368_15270, partial [Planctomycetota bacterium]